MLVEAYDGGILEVPDELCKTPSQVQWLRQPKIIKTESQWLTPRPKLLKYPLRIRFARMLGRRAWHGTPKPYIFCKRIGVI